MESGAAAPLVVYEHWTVMNYEADRLVMWLWGYYDTANEQRRRKCSDSLLQLAKDNFDFNLTFHSGVKTTICWWENTSSTYRLVLILSLEKPLPVRMLVNEEKQMIYWLIELCQSTVKTVSLVTSSNKLNTVELLLNIRNSQNWSTQLSRHCSRQYEQIYYDFHVFKDLFWVQLAAMLVLVTLNTVQQKKLCEILLYLQQTETFLTKKYLSNWLISYLWFSTEFKQDLKMISLSSFTTFQRFLQNQGRDFGWLISFTWRSANESLRHRRAKRKLRKTQSWIQASGTIQWKQFSVL